VHQTTASRALEIPRAAICGSVGPKGLEEGHMGCQKDPEDMLCPRRSAELYVFTVEKPTSGRKPELIGLEQEGETWRCGQEIMTIMRKI